MKQPKYKNEYRGAIADNTKNIKNTEHVELLYKLSEEFLNEENVEKDRNRYYKLSLVQDLVSGHMTDKEVEMLYYFNSGFKASKIKPRRK